MYSRCTSPIGILLFIFYTSISGHSRNLNPVESQLREEKSHRGLVQVSVLSRHGDRAVSDELAEGDYHLVCPSCFWPNGFANLTDIGIYRMTRLGLELKRRYKAKFLDDRPGTINEHVKAFASNYPRCIDSLNLTLRSLLDGGQSRREGYLNLARAVLTSDGKLHDESHNTYTLEDWRKLSIDTGSIFMSWSDLQGKCIKGWSYIGTENLLLDPDIRNLPGIDQFAEVIRNQFNSTLNVSILAINSNVKNELEIERTSSTFHYLDPLLSWIDQPIENEANLPIKMPDIGEQVALIYHNNQFQGKAKILQVGSLLTSVVNQQRDAITTSRGVNRTRGTMNLYNTHDSTIQVLLTELGIIDLGASGRSFEQRFAASIGQDRITRFYNGLLLPEYGCTILLELHMIHYGQNEKEYGDQFPVVRMFLYNEVDVKLDGPFEWHPMKLGSICRNKLQARGFSELNSYIPKRARDLVDPEFDCPMQLFELAYDRFIMSTNQEETYCKALEFSRINNDNKS